LKTRFAQRNASFDYKPPVTPSKNSTQHSFFAPASLNGKIRQRELEDTERINRALADKLRDPATTRSYFEASQLEKSFRNVVEI
jgi:hypothetical protein